MKKLLFPLLILLVAIFATSCIKNSESEGVKAVRMGYAALLQSQADAAITEANADDKVATAQAALLNARAAVQTANAAVVQAQAAAQLLDNAAQTEQNRHQAAVNVLREQIATAESDLRKKELADQLVEETAQSANTLLQIALQKALLQDQTATEAITAQKNLLDAQTALADAQTAAAEATAERVQNDLIFMAALKAENLGNLAAEYAAASAAYNAQQANIDVLNDNLIRATQNLDALNKSLNTDSIFTTEPAPGTFYNIRALRTTVNNAIADVASKTAAVTTATNNVSTAQAVVDADKAVLAGLQIEVIEKVIKDTLKAEQTRYKGITDQLLIATVQISDVDFVAARSAADAAVVTAQTALNTAVAAANGVAKTDSINAEFAFKLNVSPIAPVPPAWLNKRPLTGPGSGLTCWDYTIGGVHFTYVPFASAKAFQAINPVDPADDAARAVAAIVQDSLQAKYDAILAVQAAFRTTIVTQSAALAAAQIVAQPLDDKFNTLNTVVIALTAQKTASLARQAALQAEITFLDGITGKPLDLVWKDVNDKLTADNATLAAKKLLLDNASAPLGAKQNLTAAQTTLANAKTALADGLAAYTLNKPFDVQDIAFMTLQIADINAQIAAAKIILAQDLAVVNLWLAKIQTALQ